jgi:hypothetical protein
MDLEQIIRGSVPITMLTDSKSLFDIITKSSTTSEKRLQIDVAAARNAYHEGELSEIGLIASEQNLADPLTKPKSTAPLADVLKRGRLNTTVLQWIERNPLHS